MRFIGILSFLAGSSLIAQNNDIAKTLQANKWYSDGSPKYTSIIYSKTPITGQKGTAIFLKSGKIFTCDSTEERSFKENGDEVVTKARFHCDSTGTYVLKKNKIHIVEHGYANWYYKIIVKANGTIELSPIYQDEFNKE